jgi:hypothetical protein
MDVVFDDSLKYATKLYVFEKFFAGCLRILLRRHLMLLVLLQARYLAPGKAKALVDQYTGRWNTVRGQLVTLTYSLLYGSDIESFVIHDVWAFDQVISSRQGFMYPLSISTRLVCMVSCIVSNAAT